jgi:hypothetical protein
MPETEIKFADAHRGDSHLAIAKPAAIPAVIIDIDPDQILLSYKTATASFMFRGYPNKAGHLGKIVTEPFHAPNRRVAEANSRTAIQGLLSRGRVRDLTLGHPSGQLPVTWDRGCDSRQLYIKHRAGTMPKSSVHQVPSR